MPRKKRFKEKSGLTERCDKCPAIAHTKVIHRRDKTDLVFCTHHFQRFAPLLMQQGFVLATTVES